MLKSTRTITDKILNNISLIMAGRQIIEHASLIPKWEMGFKKETRIHNAHSSTSIEGNKLTLEQVKALVEHKEVITKLEITRDADIAGQIELTKKQIQILEKIKEKGKIANKDLRAMFKVSRQAIFKEISKFGSGRTMEP